VKRSKPIIYAAAALLALSLQASAGEQENSVEFDGGVDIRSILQGAKEKADAEVLKPENFQAAYSRWERDCATVSMGAQDPTTSERITLESRFYQERCYPSGPNGERSCHDEWAHTERRSVRIRLVGRGEMLPWERDVFRVCLDGHWLNADQIDASHEYSIQEPNWNDDTIVATALRKVSSLPDPAGIFAQALAAENGAKSFTLTLSDRWTSYYSGEQTVISVQFKRHRSGWFDDKLEEFEVSFPSADKYEIKFNDLKVQNNASYYVKWRFKRSGSVSKDKWQGWWETEKVRYHDASAILAAQSAFDPAFVAAQGKTVCWFKTIVKDQCVYSCQDGSTYRRQVAQPDPWDREGTTIPCPQIVIPF
jgi:hypothetical protein